MHSSKTLRCSDFDVSLNGERAALASVLPDLHEHDRLGIVVRTACGATGASLLLLAATTAFYDIQRTKSERFFIYPDHFIFHVGRLQGAYGYLDVWPPHKEVLVDDDAESVLRAVNDRAITRLLVEDRTPTSAAIEPQTLASAGARIVSQLAYAPSGRVARPDVRMTGPEVIESYVDKVFDESQLAEGERAAARSARLVDEDGRPTETYRTLTFDDALSLL